MQEDAFNSQNSIDLMACNFKVSLCKYAVTLVKDSQGDLCCRCMRAADVLDFFQLGPYSDMISDLQNLDLASSGFWLVIVEYC